MDSGSGRYMSSVFLVVEPSKMIFLISNTIPQREDIIILSYFILGTIVSPNKILRNWNPKPKRTTTSSASLFLQAHPT